MRFHIKSKLLSLCLLCLYYAYYVSTMPLLYLYYAYYACTMPIYNFALLAFFEPCLFYLNFCSTDVISSLCSAADDFIAQLLFTLIL